MSDHFWSYAVGVGLAFIVVFGGGYAAHFTHQWLKCRTARKASAPEPASVEIRTPAGSVKITR